MAKGFDMFRTSVVYLLHNLTSEKRVNKLPVSVQRILNRPFKLDGSKALERKECIKLIEILLHKLMQEHYYVIKRQKRPVVIKTMKSLISAASSNIVMNTWKLVKQHTKNVDIRKEYPDYRARLRHFAEFDKPDKYLSHEDREDFESLNNEEWWNFMKKENNETFGQYDWKIQKMEDFMAVCHHVLYRMFFEIRMFDKTALFIYTTNIFEEYLTYSRVAERVQKVLDYDLPSSAINLSKLEFSNLISQQPEEKQEYVENLKYLRRWGDKI
jgi:hypothetical protein